MDGTKRRPGRKPQIANQGVRVSLGLKVTPEVKNRLDSLAKSNGRTQSQEAELRLERSFDRTDLLTDVLQLAYGSQLAGVLLLLGESMAETARQCIFNRSHSLAGFSSWLSDPYAHAQVAVSAAEVLNGLKPPGDPSPPRFLYEAPDYPAEEIADEYKRVGQNCAHDLLDTLTGARPIPPLLPIAAKARPLLGDGVREYMLAKPPAKTEGAQ